MRPPASKLTHHDELKPLSARSALLSLLLGAHPRPMSPANLVRAGEYLDISPSTARAAITRAAASGELRRIGKDYALGKLLIARQERQDEALHPKEVLWVGDWEMAVVTTTGRTGPDRAALRGLLAQHRLSELREGIWLRPANLERPASYQSHPDLNTFRSTPEQNATDLADKLWDLKDWIQRGQHLESQLRDTTNPAQRLAVAASLVRFLSSDPILPGALLPPDWPGQSLRMAYAAYERELAVLAIL